jgi:phosphoribosylanthranilate isomerase
LWHQKIQNMLMTKVKASSITNLTDARYFAALEVEWIGFCLDPDRPEHVSPQQVAAISEWVDGVKIVGEMGSLEPDAMQTAVEQLGLDVIQVGPAVKPELVSELSDTLVIKEWWIMPGDSADSLEEELEAWSGKAAFHLLDFGRQGISYHAVATGKVFSVETLADWCQRFPILLDFDWAPEEVQTVLSTLQPVGLSLKGGEEEKVGFKSFDELDEILENLQVEE